jgi:hypothetical protein
MIYLHLTFFLLQRFLSVPYLKVNITFYSILYYSCYYKVFNFVRVAYNFILLDFTYWIIKTIIYSIMHYIPNNQHILIFRNMFWVYIVVGPRRNSYVDKMTKNITSIGKILNQFTIFKSILFVQNDTWIVAFLLIKCNRFEY